MKDIFENTETFAAIQRTIIFVILCAILVKLDALVDLVAGTQ